MTLGFWPPHGSAGNSFLIFRELSTALVVAVGKSGDDQSSALEETIISSVPKSLG